MNTPKPLYIPDIIQDIKIGDRVRCYNTDYKNADSFVGYGTVTEILDDRNYCWCENHDRNFYLNYAFYVVKV